MQVQKFVEIIGAEFYAGVPDSQLKALCNYLINTYGIDSRHHVIAANHSAHDGFKYAVINFVACRPTLLPSSEI